MYDVRISDSTYEQARQAAQEQHVSLEAFIEEAVQLRLQEETLRLTPEQVATVRAAQEDVKAGRVYTPEQARADLDAHRKEWRAAHPS